MDIGQVLQDDGIMTGMLGVLSFAHKAVDSDAAWDAVWAEGIGTRNLDKDDARRRLHSVIGGLQGLMRAAAEGADFGFDGPPEPKRRWLRRRRDTAPVITPPPDMTI